MPVISKCQITELIESALRRNGLPDALSARSAAIVAKELWGRFSGSRVYFAKGRHTASRQSAIIYAAFTGANQLELAQEYGLTVSRIEQIISGALRERKKNELPK